MGWIGLILLILWAFWMFIKNMPRIIALGLKLLVGFLFLGLCIKAYVLISAGAAASYLFLSLNGWSILCIVAGVVGVSLIFRICHVVHDRANLVLVRTPNAVSSSNDVTSADFINHMQNQTETNVRGYLPPQPSREQDAVHQNSPQLLQSESTEFDRGGPQTGEANPWSPALDLLHDIYAQTLMRQAHEYLEQHRIPETKRNVLRCVKRMWNLSIDIPGSSSRLIDEQEAKAIFSEIAETLRTR